MRDLFGVESASVLQNVFLNQGSDPRFIRATLDSLTKEERATLKAGCLINYYKG